MLGRRPLSYGGKQVCLRRNSKVFSIFDKYGTKTVKTIEDVVGLIGG